MLNAEQISQENLLVLDHAKGKSAQVGYDITLQTVRKISGATKPGRILKHTTVLCEYSEPLDTIRDDGNYEGWLLSPGVYDVTFNEGCRIPSNRTGFIKQRSSLYRNGAIINSPVFDPGFQTQNMGTLMYVFEPIFIEKDARIAQMYFHESTSTTELYDGQWQNDKQRQVQ
jgi:deoxycytidine triphosphate deaminase